MNLFEKYETEHRPFTAGKMFKCIHPDYKPFHPVIKILTREYSLYYCKVVKGEHLGYRGWYTLEYIKTCFQPYVGELEDESEIQSEELANA